MPCTLPALSAQIYDDIQVSFGVEATGPFDVEMWIISKSVSRYTTPVFVRPWARMTLASARDGAFA